MNPVSIGDCLIVNQEDFLFAIGPIGCETEGNFWYDIRLPNIRIAISSDEFERIRGKFELISCTYMDKSGRPFEAYINKPAVMCIHRHGRTSHVYFQKNTCVLEVITTEAEELKLKRAVPA